MQRQETVEQFRERLSEIIARSGLSRSAFAQKIGIDRSTLSQILSSATNRLPRVETLTAIAVSEQVSIDWLVGLTQEGGLTTKILDVEVHPGGLSPLDEHLQIWHAEAIGYKIRYIPATLPDLFKTEEVIEYEYRESAMATPEQRRESSQASLDLQRRPETDMEVCSPVQRIESFAHGEGMWRGLAVGLRRKQLEHMITLAEELYPTFRWFLYDRRTHFSVPLTVFGVRRAIIYLGQKYLVLNSRELIKMLTLHFDALIRAAIVEPTQAVNLLKKHHQEL
jgi:transcriptional regulator with XRE-family HTH domain